LKIHYTLHALERMKQRGVNRELIESCLNKSDKIDKLDNIYRCVKKINKKVLVVVYRKTCDTILVITTFISSKINKYLF